MKSLQNNQMIPSNLFKLSLFGVLLLALFSSTMSMELENYSKNLEVFAHNVYEKLSSSEPNKNVVFSPFSIQACAAMARLGAIGETASQLDKGLVLPSSNLNEIAGTFQNVLSKYENSNVLKIANKIYVMKNYTIKHQFNELISKNFYSTADEIDFGRPAEAAQTINGWVESKTNNLIKDLISPSALDALTRLVLVNAIHFKGEWKHPFSKERTRDERFYLNENDFVDVPMMNLKESFRYAELPDLDAKALEMPYKDSDLSMLIILPNSRTGLKQLESKLKTVSWSDINSKLSRRQVTVKLPKFKAEFSVELSEIFKQLGMSKMFSDSAEFPNMLESNESLKVSKVIHKAFIDVNEEGTEAAAATGFIINRFSAPAPVDLHNEFIADRSFYYVIRNVRDINLFAGKVVEIEKVENPQQAEKTNKVEKIDQVEKVEKVEKLENLDLVAKVEQIFNLSKDEKSRHLVFRP